MDQNRWFVKMRPLLGLTGMGGGGAGLTLGGGAVPFIASGGDQNGVTPGNGWKYHTFYSTGPSTFTVTQGTTACKVLVLGGGGGGGQAPADAGAGAGAGGLVYHDSWELEPGTYDISVGSGGAGNQGNPGGSPYQGSHGTDTTFSTPTMTCTAMGGHAGNNAPSFTPYAGVAKGCGMGGGNYYAESSTNVEGGQPLQAQPGVPSGYVNFGQPGGFTMARKSYFTHTPISAVFGPTHPTMPTWYPQSSGGGGGGCGMAGIGYSMTKFAPPTSGTPQAGKWEDLMGGSGGNGWAGPPLFKYTDVFGPASPTVGGQNPTGNLYGGGGAAAIGPKNKNNIPSSVWPSSPKQAPNPGNPSGTGIVENPTGQHTANQRGYGGGGGGYTPGYSWPTNTATHYPFFGPKLPGADKLGGGGATSDYTWPNHPTNPAAGNGGSGLVVIAYYEDIGGAPSGTSVPVAMWGGGGGGGAGPSSGGGGGYYSGTLNLPPGDYTFCVGGAGAADGASTLPGGSVYGGGPIAHNNSDGGGGGGYSGFFREDFTSSGNEISMKGMTKGGQSSSAPSPTIGNQWYMGPGDAANYADLNILQQHTIFMVGGGGAAGDSPTGGGGAGGYDSGDPGREPTSTWPFEGAGQGGTNSLSEYGGRGGYGGAGGSSPTTYGRPGLQMCGGWIGDIDQGGGQGGGGYWGGGQGAVGPSHVLGGGGSGHIDPAWVSPGASGEMGNPGCASPNPAYAGGQSNPLYPGTAGTGGAGLPNSGCGGGSIVFGPHGGTMAVTPPGGSPASLPSSGQAFDTAGVYKLTVS